MGIGVAMEVGRRGKHADSGTCLGKGVLGDRGSGEWGLWEVALGRGSGEIGVLGRWEARYGLLV